MSSLFSLALHIFGLIIHRIKLRIEIYFKSNPSMLAQCYLTTLYMLSVTEKWQKNEATKTSQSGNNKIVHIF